MRPSALAPIAALAAGCTSGVGHALDDVASVHTRGVTDRTFEHLHEVERFDGWNAWLIWGPLRAIPGLSDSAKRSPEKLDDPSSFCTERVSELAEFDPKNLAEIAEVLYWTGGILEGDPFPLSKIHAVRVVAKIVRTTGATLALLPGREVEYIAATDRRVKRFGQICELAFAGALTPEIREEFLKIIRDLGATPYVRPSEPRGIARSLAFTSSKLPDPDPTVRETLVSSAAVLVARGSIQTLDRALTDPDAYVRSAAAREMVRSLGAPAVARVVEKLRDDRNADVRREVAALAGRAGRADRPESEPIVEYLALAATRTEEDPSVAVNAMESLGRITGVGRRFDVDFWRAWWQRRILEHPQASSRP